MSDNQEQVIRKRLETETDFWERQRLLKALWKLQQPADGSAARRPASHAA